MLVDELKQKTDSGVMEKVVQLKEQMAQEAEKGNKMLVVTTTDDAENLQIMQYFRNEGLRAKMRYQNDTPIMVFDWSERKPSLLQRVIDTLYVHVKHHEKKPKEA